MKSGSVDGETSAEPDKRDRDLPEDNVNNMATGPAKPMTPVSPKFLPGACEATRTGRRREEGAEQSASHDGE